ncbi:telomere-protecting terminal protein Tpg [Streptomyces europaeiscabiei]|uniref:telomere-protecting terminal protein Tpg n=1 Tax=Streptomyces europaeiscabiei TaxID=146819 RepID=UPI0038D40B37
MPALSPTSGVSAAVGVDAAVRSRWCQTSAAQAATTSGITMETRARFGCTEPIGTTDDARFRCLTVHLLPEYARRLLGAQARGVGDRQERDIVAEGLREVYFKDGGRRAADLDVALQDIDHFDVSFWPTCPRDVAGAGAGGYLLGLSTFDRFLSLVGWRGVLWGSWRCLRCVP